MNKSMKFGLLATFSVASLLVACGEDTTINNYTTTAIEDYTFKTLPDCGKSTEGMVAFVTNKEQLMYCSDGEWLTLNGEDGEKGKQGIQGEKGEKGDKGDKGDKGVAGDSCKASILPDASGYKITCGKDSVGVVKNGAKGDKGETGVDGESCFMKKVTNKADTVAVVICKKDTVWLTKGKDATIGGNGGNSGEGGSGEGGNGGDSGNKPQDNQNTPTEGSMPNGLVIIGNQVWSGQNVNDATKGGTCYSNLESKCKIFGRLYTWAEAMDLEIKYNKETAAEDVGKKNYQGICPDGFHIPTEQDWENLRNYVNAHYPKRDSIIKANDWYDDTDISGVLLRGTTYDYNENKIWSTESGTVYANDYYGFMVVGAGRGYFGLNWNEEKEEEVLEYYNFEDGLKGAYFWTNSELTGSEDDIAITYQFTFEDSGFRDDYWEKSLAYSVRCMMNMSAEDYMKTEEYKNLFVKKD